VRRGSLRNAAACLAVIAQVIVLTASNASVSAAPSGKITDLQISGMQDIVSHNRDVFGGLVVDQSTQSVTVFLAPSSDPSRRQLALSALTELGNSPTDPRFGAPIWTLRYVSVGPSLAALDSILLRVKSQAWSTDIGAHLISFAINPPLHAVWVGVDEITAAIASDAQVAFGNLVVLKRKDRPRLFSRMLDAQPYWGGDRILINAWWGYAGQCTSGFPATDNGNHHRGMLTAGHCANAGGGTGTNFQQGYIDSGGTAHVTGNLGNATHVSYSNYSLDGAFLDSQAAGTSVQDDVYTTGGIWGSSSALVIAWGQSSNGMGICLDGSFTTENCYGTVINTEQCVNFDGQFQCNVTEVSIPGNRVPGCQAGDSGGPAYRYLGSQRIAAYGLVEGGNNNGSDCYYTEIRDAMNVLGVSIIAG
jgi:hypothetical protein